MIVSAYKYLVILEYLMFFTISKIFTQRAAINQFFWQN